MRGQVGLALYLAEYCRITPADAGTRRTGRVWYRMRRITPADAGTSILAVCPVFAIGDHPRGCGDKPSVCLSKSSARGSPPRMRGQVNLDALGNSFYGITPADAGTRDWGHVDLKKEGDHPRGCGDKRLSGVRFPIV